MQSYVIRRFFPLKVSPFCECGGNELMSWLQESSLQKRITFPRLFFFPLSNTWWKPAFPITCMFSFSQTLSVIIYGDSDTIKRMILKRFLHWGDKDSQNRHADQFEFQKIFSSYWKHTPHPSDSQNAIKIKTITIPELHITLFLLKFL